MLAQRTSKPQNKRCCADVRFLMEKQIKSFRLVFRRCHAQRLTGHMILYVRLLSASSRPHRQSVMSGQTAHIESNVFVFFYQQPPMYFRLMAAIISLYRILLRAKKKKTRRTRVYVVVTCLRCRRTLACLALEPAHLLLTYI